jgi:hypothetical protein
MIPFFTSGSGLIKLLKGQYIFFNGDVAHRGCTYNELSWHPAIHLHLDTRHHRRKAGVVEFTDDKEDEAMERLRYHLDCVQRIMAEAFANGWKKVLALGNKTCTNLNCRLHSLVYATALWLDIV